MTHTWDAENCTVAAATKFLAVAQAHSPPDQSVSAPASQPVITDDSSCCLLTVCGARR